MVHAGVLKKFGVYGLLRIGVPLLPQGAQLWVDALALLCLGNILFNGLVAMRQRQLDWLIGNSSVAHMGFVFLGIASLNLLGITGAVVVMVAHGLLAALTFGLSGYVRQQTGTLDMEQLGGLLRRLPFVGAVLTMAMLAGCGLPGFGNFVGEALVLFGAWKAQPLAAVLALWGALVIGAVYMLRAVRAILHGPLPERWAHVADAGDPWVKLPYLVLLGSLLLLGIYPRILTDKIKPDADRILSAVTSGSPVALTSTSARVSLSPAQPEQRRSGETPSSPGIFGYHKSVSPQIHSSEMLRLDGVSPDRGWRINPR